MLASSKTIPNGTQSFVFTSGVQPHAEASGTSCVAALLVSRCNLPGTELALDVEAALPVWGDVVERPSTMGEELISHIIHP